MANPGPGPAPATPLIANLLNNALGNVPALAFDVELANNSPDAVGRPPAAAAVNQHDASPAWGAMLPVAALPACHDRASHLTTPATPPCLSNPSHPGMPIFPPPWPIGAGATAQFQCAHGGMLNGLAHPGPHNICRHCLIDIRNQPWSIAILNDVTVQPPRQLQPQPLTAAVAPAGTGVWTRFMTRMCVPCEIREIILLRDRLAAPGAWPFGSTVRTARSDQLHDQYPYVTCECLQNWHEHCTPTHDVCIQHRHRRACAKHDEMLIMRAQNDQWLRQTGRDPSNQNRLVRVSAAVTAGRAATGIYRACRCGEVPKLNATPRVFQCLGCEGVIHLTRPPPGAGQITLPAGFPNMQTRRSANATANGYPLRRPRQ